MTRNRRLRQLWKKKERRDAEKPFLPKFKNRCGGRAPRSIHPAAGESCFTLPDPSGHIELPCWERERWLSREHFTPGVQACGMWLQVFVFSGKHKANVLLAQCHSSYFPTYTVKHWLENIPYPCHFASRWARDQVYGRDIWDENEQV